MVDHDLSELAASLGQFLRIAVAAFVLLFLIPVILILGALTILIARVLGVPLTATRSFPPQLSTSELERRYSVR
jgi:hypothetical protein